MSCAIVYFVSFVKEQVSFRLFALNGTVSGYNLALSLRGVRTKGQTADFTVYWLQVTVYKLVQLLYTSIPAVFLHDEVFSMPYWAKITMPF